MRVGLWCVIVVFPDLTHFFRGWDVSESCVLLFIWILVFMIHDYLLTKTESGAKIWSVKYIYPTYWLKLLSILKRGFCCCLLSPCFFLKKRCGYCNHLRPSVTLSPTKSLDEIQPNLVCVCVAHTKIGCAATHLFLARPQGPCGGIKRSNIIKYH